jgi:tRNA pseudouridine38-40 synthase
MRYKIEIEYKGTAYNGWQRQKNGLSIQQTIEDVIFELFNQKTAVVGAGRTDAGVHALGQVAHFDLNCALCGNSMAKALNSRLPNDIKVRGAQKVDAEFCSNACAKQKTYLYRLYVADTVRPLKDEFSEMVRPPLNVELMKQAAALLVGRHDFEAFSSAHRSVKTTVREIFSLNIIQNDEDVLIEITGNGFLYNMVRIIVGTLVEIGKGKKDASVILQMFETKNRALGGKTYPAKGLTLVGVDYS